MSHLADSRGEALANSAVTMVDSTLGTICERIQASAAAVALNYRNGDQENAVEMAQLLVDRAVVDGVVFSSLASVSTSPATDIGAEAPDGSWVDCGEGAAYEEAGPIVALGAQAESGGGDQHHPQPLLRRLQYGRRGFWHPRWARRDRVARCGPGCHPMTPSAC